MLPLYLSIEGLYSYRKRQELHFEKLTSAQLFGIFGNVGSGKSSLLEAMTLAIYGKNERVITKEQNHLINLQSSKAHVIFDCLVGTSKYRFEWKAIRQKEGDIKKSHRIYVFENAAWKALPTEKNDKFSEELLHIKYEYFKQAIVIPQGKFRDFIELSPTKRANLLEDLFHLEPFKLGQSARKLLNKEKEKLSQLYGKLDELEEITEEKYEETQKELVTVQQLSSKILQELEQTQNIIKAQQEAFTTFQELQQAQQQLSALLEEQPSIEEKKRQLLSYQKAFAIVRPLAEKRQELVEASQNIYKDLQSLTNILQNLQSENASVENEFQKTQQDYEQIQDFQTKIHDLQAIASLIDCKQEISSLQNQQKELQVRLESYTKQIESQTKQYDLLKNEIIRLKEKTPNIALLAQKLQAAENFQNLNTQLTELQERIKKIQNEKKQVFQEIKYLFENQQNVALSSLIKIYESYTNHFLEKIEQLSKELQPYRIREQLASFAHHLQEGEPCPLCGSTHHPHKYTDNEKEKRLFLEKEIEQYNISLQESQNHLKKLQSFQIEQERYNFQEEELQKRIDEIEHQKTKYSGAPELSVAQKNLENAQRYLNEIQIKEKRLYEIEKNIKSTQAEKEKLQNQYFEVQQRIASKNGEYQNIQSTIKNIQFLSYLNYPKEKILESISKGKEKIERIEKNYHQIQKRRETLEKEILSNKVQLEEKQKQMESISSELVHNEQQLSIALKDCGFESLENIQNIIKNPLEIEKENNFISEYEHRLAIAKARYEQLTKKQQNNPYQAELLESNRALFQQQNLQYQNLIQKLGALNHHLQIFQQKLEKKKQLLSEIKVLEKRVSGFEQISKLLYGEAFMKWVSGYYFSQLIASANRRFQVLTNYSLSLALDETQENIIVHDHLNGGKTRLLKTLSGGQIFQASLCLALALAESIHSANMVAHSFFFIDEGFGNLDKQSLQLVIETLQNLKKENRIVGIISHVEELQQKINVFAYIQQKKDGSQIRYSWEMF
ncbi:MAG: SMC family ATPase [Cytophagales bacterium]|nr:SMC family ATPase [Cytophagales bacterium]MDW8384153.1 SMC family ATPase [Flammeovirgaceae bacterium]